MTLFRNKKLVVILAIIAFFTVEPVGWVATQYACKVHDGFGPDNLLPWDGVFVQGVFVESEGNDLANCTSQCTSLLAAGVPYVEFYLAKPDGYGVLLTAGYYRYTMANWGDASCSWRKSWDGMHSWRGINARLPEGKCLVITPIEKPTAPYRYTESRGTIVYALPGRIWRWHREITDAAMGEILAERNFYAYSSVWNYLLPATARWRCADASHLKGSGGLAKEIFK